MRLYLRISHRWGRDPIIKRKCKWVPAGLARLIDKREYLQGNLEAEKTKRRMRWLMRIVVQLLSAAMPQRHNIIKAYAFNIDESHPLPLMHQGLVLSHARPRCRAAFRLWA